METVSKQVKNFLGVFKMAGTVYEREICTSDPQFSRLLCTSSVFTNEQITTNAQYSQRCFPVNLRLEVGAQ